MAPVHEQVLPNEYVAQIPAVDLSTLTFVLAYLEEHAKLPNLEVTSIL